MTPNPQMVDALLDALWLDLPQLCRLAGVTEDWLQARLGLDILQLPAQAAPDAWRFDAADLRRVRRIAQLERDFDAVPELAALVADLEAELAQLRALLHRRGLP
jgi:chaperone modulatory protein CbpM